MRILDFSCQQCSMENKTLICPRCLNSDPAYFYKGQRGVYCRKCVSFKRILLLDDIAPNEYEVNSSGEFHFDYELTPYQKEASVKTYRALQYGDVLLKCVCGAGKTEICVLSISKYLSLGKKVCYAISRKEVVIELSARFQKIFNTSNVIAVYGGHHEELFGDLIVCTTHQLYRYQKTFDLLILDEVDAFPLSGNQTLMNIALNSAKGQIVFSTATVNDFLKRVLEKRKYREVCLLLRPSLKPLIEPKVIYGPKIYLLIRLTRILYTMTNQCIVFVPTKKEAYYFYLFFKNIFSCAYVYSDLAKRREMIESFRNKEVQFIFATSVLERGITIKDVDVIIYSDQTNTFDKASIIQMTGRVGRSISNPYGEAFILSKSKNKEIINAIKEIKEANNFYEMSILRQGN